MKLNFTQVNVLVVGDIMLDQYWYGDTSRISPEAPVPVVNIKQAENRLGGAANVAKNIASLGAKVTLIGAIGRDDNAKIIKTLSLESKINLDCQEISAPTIAKLRVVGRQQQLLRLDFEEKSSEINLLTHFHRNLDKADMVILSDYDKGALDNMAYFIEQAKLAGKIVVVDPKRYALEVYKNADCLTPNRTEFEKMVGQACLTDHHFEFQGFALIQKLGIKNLLITRGAQGMTLLQSEKNQVLHIPTKAREIYDITGAGDTVIATLGTALAGQFSWEEAVKLSNVAAGAVVGKLGTSAIEVDELERLWQQNECTELEDNILTEQEAQAKIKLAKQQGKRVIMTNGCFDLLHPGHIRYLEQAKKLGHFLLVAVNSDESIKRLKGPSRPIHALEHRMKVLLGLKSVDWVVPFTEDTPERLISVLLPDVLVKGGDYKIADIAGAESVLRSGGEVKVLDFVDGFSTTKSINQIQEKALL
jgi:D-beta-D-heptose 7-phosphate kinase/D-beta-D-heptose 1-phosphate adenosyltransferase